LESSPDLTWKMMIPDSVIEIYKESIRVQLPLTVSKELVL
jgi:hypothetical protein